MNLISRILRRTKDNQENQNTSKHEHVSDNPEATANVAGDNPIRWAEDDRLGRAGVAHSFAHQVLSLDVKEGVVVGVLGAWGSGKTSFINLARPEFEQADGIILDFNPWMFSGAEQLVDRFFTELAAQLRLRREFSEIAEDIAEYGEVFSNLVWLPFVGPWIATMKGASKILSKFLERRSEGVGGRRKKLDNALTKLDHPIVVVIDDIDRLSSSEIRDVFKLVRLTANFPNIIYVVAFDRSRVEDALAEQGVPGRDYLEKILQVVIDLPAIPPQVLDREIFAAIDSALSRIDKPGVFDANMWPDVFMEVIRPLLRNMRDVRRYTAAIFGTVKALDGQIALVDVLALEAIRTFLPDVFSQFHTAIEGLTTTGNVSYGNRSESPHLKASVDALINTGGAQEQLVRSMIKRLFPAAERYIGGSHYGSEWAGQWLRERRIAHEHILRLYLERVAGAGLQAFMDAEVAFSLMAERVAFESYLDSLDAKRLARLCTKVAKNKDGMISFGFLRQKSKKAHHATGNYEPDGALCASISTTNMGQSAGNVDRSHSGSWEADSERDIAGSWQKPGSKLRQISPCAEPGAVVEQGFERATAAAGGGHVWRQPGGAGDGRAH